MLRIKFASAAGVLAAVVWGSAVAAATGGPPLPTFDIHAACKALQMVPEAMSVDTGQPDALRHCVEAEQQARNQLAREWTKFSPADRNLCVGESKSGGVAPVYSELETCLQMTRDSRQLNNQQTGDNGGEGTGGSPAAPPGPTAQNQK